MAIKSKDEILTAVRDFIGENTDDTTLAMLEDIDDTFNDFDTRLNDNTDYKQKYEENDAEWRKRYHDRFFDGGTNEDEEDFLKQKTTQQGETKLHFEDLFTTK